LAGPRLGESPASSHQLVAPAGRNSAVVFCTGSAARRSSSTQPQSSASDCSAVTPDWCGSADSRRSWRNIKTRVPIWIASRSRSERSCTCRPFTNVPLIDLKSSSR